MVSLFQFHRVAAPLYALCDYPATIPEYRGGVITARSLIRHLIDTATMSPTGPQNRTRLVQHVMDD